MAVEAVAKTGFPGIWIHGKSIRVDFMHQGLRHRHTVGLDPTKASLKHAARLRSAALYALRTGTYNEAEMFPHTRPAESAAQTSKRLEHQMGQSDSARGNPTAPALSDLTHLCMLEPDGSRQPSLHRQSDGP